MNLSDIQFPIYVVHTDDVVRQDGILWCEGAVIDDRNTVGASLGERRLKTPMKNLYDLKYQIDDFSIFRNPNLQIPTLRERQIYQLLSAEKK